MKQETQKLQENPVTGDMLIGEVVAKYPQAAQVMTDFGLHCIGCHVNPVESIEEGALSHEMPKETFEEMMKEVNLAAKNGKAHASAHAQKDFSDEKVSLTEMAAQKVAEFRKLEGKDEKFGLRVSAIPGGCAGYQYALEFDQPAENDIVMEEHGVKVIVAPNHMEMLAGVQIDFVDGLHGTGFKINNPGASGSCGCGKSFH